jgi:hypothetical protein
VAGEIDPLRVVNDAIENGVSVGGIADQLVPFVDRDLAGDDRRSPTVAFFEDFEEVVAGGGIERLKTPIIELAICAVVSIAFGLAAVVLHMGGRPLPDEERSRLGS